MNVPRSNVPASARSNAGPSSDPAPPSLREGVTSRGWLLLVTGASVALSSSLSFRVGFAGLSLHPFLAPLAALILLSGWASFRRFPSRLAAAFVTYDVVLAVVAFAHLFELGPVIKAATFTVVVITLAVSPRTRADIRFGALGFVAGISVVSLQALVSQVAGIEGINPFAEVGNKNAFSVYALPAMLLAAFYVLDRATAKRLRLLFAVGSVIIIVATFSTANRSGWFCVIVIGVMLLARGRRLRDVIVIVVLGAAAFYVLTTFGSTQAYVSRSSSSNAEASDDRRIELIVESWHIGAADPLFGAGPFGMQERLATRFGLDPATSNPGANQLSAHNLYAFVWGAGAIPLTAAFLWIAFELLRRPRQWLAVTPTKDARMALSLVRMMTVLFIVRGWFSEDSFTIPGFMFGFGFALAGLVFETAPPVRRPTANERRAQLDAMRTNAMNAARQQYLANNAARAEQR